MKISNFSLLLIALIMFTQSAVGQGFVNLDFEQTTIRPTAVGGATEDWDPEQLFPGWTVGGLFTFVSYNNFSIGAPAVILMGPNFSSFSGYLPLQGSYSVLMQYYAYTSLQPTFSQNGLIPSGSRSINFLVAPGTDPSEAIVTVDGTSIPLYSMFEDRLSGDISAFSGNTVELAFSTPITGAQLYFDDIQFSPLAVPEPTSFGFIILSVVLIICWKNWPNQATQRIPVSRSALHLHRWS